MLAFWLCGVTLAFVLCMADILPPFSNLQVRALGFTGVIPSGCWIQVAGLLANIGGAVLFPYLPSRKSDLCFLDFVCIDQADTDRMQEGIMSISGFLSASAELRVLWSAPLLSRLWCVFEIAAYRKLNPGGKITMSPVNNEVSALMVFGGWQMFTFTLWIARAGVEGSNPLVLLAVMTFVFALLMPALALSLYRNHTATAKLRFELANFDVMKVNCSNDFDRDCIHAAIIECLPMAPHATCVVSLATVVRLALMLPGFEVPAWQRQGSGTAAPDRGATRRRWRLAGSSKPTRRRPTM
eukprot:g7513.t1